MSKPHVLNDFFPESGEDKATVAGILLQMGYKLPEGSLSALETDLTELGVDAFVAEIPEGTGVRQKATFQRFLKALVGGEKIQSSEVSPFWGNVYVEGTVYNRQNEGQGSLHCNSMEDCYISWERQSGKRFANGDPYPMRRSLKVASFDAATRTFTYILNIPEGIELHGSRPSKANPRRHGQGPWFPPACRIEKTAVFSEDFSTMVSHKIKEYNHAGVLQFESDTELFVQRPPALTQLAKSMSPILGSAYVRGPVFVASREGFASFHFDSFYHCYISCAVAPSAWKLDDGLQVPVKNVFDEVSFDPATQLFRGVIKFDRIVLGASRREYTMIFSEDFLSIDSGTVQDLDAQDTVVARRYLGPSHDLSYVRKPSTVTTSGGGGAGASQHRPRLLPNVPLPDEQPYRPNGGLIYLHNQYLDRSS